MAAAELLTTVAATTTTVPDPYGRLHTATPGNSLPKSALKVGTLWTQFQRVRCRWSWNHTDNTRLPVLLGGYDSVGFQLQELQDIRGILVWRGGKYSPFVSERVMQGYF